MKYVIGVDLGTSATKTILVDQNGKIVAEASVKYPMYQPENGWAEQDPSDWSEAAISTIKSVVEKGQVNGKDVRGIGISGQMHGLVMLNEENQVIRRSIIWCDQRATKQVEEMLELPVPEKVKQYVSGVMSQTEELDNIISEYSKQRSLNRVPAVNRSILRLALYELKNLPQTPVNVVISEAVHLSQAYAYAEDTAFINGVLGAYARSKPAVKEETADGTNSGD